MLEGGFWMNSIKTHCYATFKGKETAERAIAALQGLQWPPQSFKRLEAKIGDMSAEEVSLVFLSFFRCCVLILPRAGYGNGSHGHVSVSARLLATTCDEAARNE